jgi:iron complex outermembrane recepter protein
MKLLLSFVLSFGLLTAYSQTLVKGNVVDNNGEPLPGALILEKGTSNGVITDYNGMFELVISNESATLVISFVGFATQEVIVSGQGRINVKLLESIQQLSEVTVKGFIGVVGKSRKRTESIQSTPESVTAFNSQGIEKLGINNVTTFSNLVPNLRMTETQAAGVNSLIIRGIPQIRNSDAPVAFVIDGVTIPDPSLLNQELFDLALIEVVKGPQGALYGKNAIGGAINIYTKEPTNEFRNRVSVGYGNSNTFVGSLVSSGALSKDKLYYRVSGQYKNFDGLLTNEFLDKKVDFKKDFNLRGQLTADLSSNFRASVTVQHINNKMGATYYSVNPSYRTDQDWIDFGFLPILDANPKDGNNIIDQDVFGESDLKNTYGNLNLQYSSSKITFQSITSINKVDRSTIGDLDFTRLTIDEFGLDQGETNDTQSFNQEIRVSNTTNTSKVNWTLGGFYQSIERNFFQSDLTFSDTWAVTDYTATFNTLAFFGFVDYKMSDKFTTSVGLRFDSDKFDLDDFLSGEKTDKSDDVLQPKVSLSYQASDDVLIYTNYGRGYRSGGFNPSVTTLFNRDFRKEISDNYELGFKTSSWGKRFILNGSVFYSDFTDRQQNTITSDTFIPGNYNYNKSEIVGFEIDTKLRLSKYLDLLFNYGQVKSTITEGGSTGGPNGDDQDLNAFNDNNTSLVPQNNFNIGLESGFAVGANSTIDLNVNYNHTGKIYWNDANDDFATSDSYQLLDFRATLSVKKLKLTLWGRNILDTQYYMEYQAFGIGWRGTPATFGTTVSIDF